jgi:hypothetical protein
MSSINDKIEIVLSPASQAHMDNLLDSFEEGELIEDEITPPPSPLSSPPTPPTSVDSDVNILRSRIDDMERQLHLMEMILQSDQIISMAGVTNLRRNTGLTWFNRIQYLLYFSNIPPLWVLRVVPTDHEIDPDCVDIYVVNHQVKMTVMHALNMYLRDHYENDVYIL